MISRIVIASETAGSQIGINPAETHRKFKNFLCVIGLSQEPIFLLTTYNYASYKAKKRRNYCRIS